MASYIRFSATTGLTVYAVYQNADGQFWNAATDAFENYSGANWVLTKYIIVGTEPTAPGLYQVAVPSMPAGAIYWNAYQRVGGSPATSDTRLDNGDFAWSGAGFNTAIGNAGSNSVTVGELRTALRYSGRNVGISDLDETVYDLTEKDLAIQDILNDFIRQTRCTNKLDDLTVGEGYGTADFSILDGFHPSRLIGQRLWIDGKIDIQEDLGVVLDARRCRPDETGTPEESGFTTPTTLEVWPTADDDYTINVMWTPPLTAWEAGDADAGDTPINVPKDLALRAVRTGGVVSLQNGGIENVPMTDRSRAAYDKHVLASKGLGSLSGPTTHGGDLNYKSRRRWQGG